MTVEQWHALPPTAGLPLFDSHVLQRHRPDAHWAVVNSHGVTAHCSLWWRATPAHFQHRIGLIGHFAAATEEAARELLALACRELAAAGCTLAIGPMDGNTWRDYRFVTHSAELPCFLMEPNNPAEWPVQFLRSGFTDFARYFSALAEDLTLKYPRVERAWGRMKNCGVRIRPVSADQFDADLKKIYAVARVAFRDHILYQEIQELEFIQQYEALRAKVPLDLVLLAETDSRAIGFGFAVPDLLQAQRGEPVHTVVIKTLAALPEREFAGLGQVLLEALQQRAADMGFRRAIHALVGEVDNLQRISARYAVPFRRYALFAKDLSQ